MAIDYLRNRGLSGEIAKRYHLGYAPEGWHNLEKAFPNNQRELLSTGMLIKSDEGKIYDRYRNRIMFPIHDRNGRVIGFGGRVLDKDQNPNTLTRLKQYFFKKVVSYMAYIKSCLSRKIPTVLLLLKVIWMSLPWHNMAFLMWLQHWELPPAHSIYNYWQSIPNISFFALMVMRQVNKQPGEHWRAVYRI